MVSQRGFICQFNNSRISVVVILWITVHDWIRQQISKSSSLNLSSCLSISSHTTNHNNNSYQPDSCKHAQWQKSSSINVYECFFKDQHKSRRSVRIYVIVSSEWVVLCNGNLICLQSRQYSCHHSIQILTAATHTHTQTHQQMIIRLSAGEAVTTL